MNVRKFAVLAVTAAAFLVFDTQIPALASANAQTATEQEQAIGLIDHLGQKAVKLLSNADLDSQGKRDGFSDLVSRDFDMALIGKFVLGKHWRKATETQRTEYQEIFKKYMVASYQKRISDYSGEALKILNAKPLNEKEFLVKSVIIRPKGPPINLDWRVRKTKSGEQKIIDIVVENVSMALTHREEFSSVINRNGGTVDGLIKELRDHMEDTKS